MALSKTAATHIAARLQVIEAITNLILQELPQTLGEDVIEGMTVAQRRFLREKMALYKSIIRDLRTRGGDASTADEITRAQIGRLYLDAQDTMGHINDATRKLRALTSDAIEDAPVVTAQKTVWNTKVTESLAALDAGIAAFPDEVQSEGGGE